MPAFDPTGESEAIIDLYEVPAVDNEARFKVEFNYDGGDWKIDFKGNQTLRHFGDTCLQSWLREGGNGKPICLDALVTGRLRFTVGTGDTIQRSESRRNERHQVLKLRFRDLDTDPIRIGRLRSSQEGRLL